MGLLSQGEPLQWEEVKKFAQYVRTHGVLQLINIFERLKDRKADALLWGDEVECIIVKLDEEGRKATVALEGKTLLEKMEHVAATWPETPAGVVIWHPEFGRYMIESTPGKPYGGTLRDFLKVEPNMKLRRIQAASAFPEATHLMTVTVFPRLGCKDFTTPHLKPSPDGAISQSLFFPDEAINEHPRFPALATNIRKRRGKKVAMNVPIFRDAKTPAPFVEEIHYEGTGEGASAAQPDHIYMDAMGFGMGNCCLQVTFQASSLAEARDVYDQLAVVAPIMLALSASSPVFKGFLSDVDARWDVISGAVDCRTPEEKGEVPLTTPGARVIAKSRYDSISSFLSTSRLHKKEYDDVALEYDEETYDVLVKHGFDPILAKHFAHLFIRDPLVLYRELIEQDDAKSSDHFENIQSTNWQTMRFKPPPPDSNIGWRVEFRPCEVQLTDFENAAFVVFIVLLTRVILSFGLNLYMPLSKVDENMKTAQKRDAARSGVFHFRTQLSECLPVGSPAVAHAHDPDETALMSLGEIFNGKHGVFPGLIPMIEVYLKSMEIDVETRLCINKYLAFISKKASGELKTAATYMREFIRGHPEYKQDSVVTDAINYDLMKHIIDIANGTVHPEDLLGPKE